MAKKLNLRIDLPGLKAQFQGLQGRHPGLWPVVPKAAMLVGLFSVILVVGYLLYWKGLFEELEGGKLDEETLKAQYIDKMKQAVNLDALRQQKEQVTVYVGQLEKQLPSKAEMDALLTDINQAGIGRGLQFELFKPGAVAVKDYYAELPISIRLAGGYHDLGGFTSDLSNLARIVTLNNLNVQLQEKTGRLSLEAVAKTFRYLDAEEIAVQRREAAKAKAAKAAAAGGGKEGAK